MRIALNAWFIDRPTTGSGQYLTNLVAEYGARHTEHTFLLCGHKSQERSLALWAGRSPCLEWRALRTPFDNLSRHLAKIWFEQVTVPLVCRRWPADLLHVPYWASPLFPGLPTVVTIHDLIPLLLPAYHGGTRGRVYNRLVTASAHRAARALTDSEAARGDILCHLGLPPDRVQAVHLAAEERFEPVRDPAILGQVRQKYHLPRRYMLYLGGFDVRKNVSGILHAFASLNTPSVKLVVAGRLPRQDNDFFPSPRRIAVELDILDWVRFTGWVDEEDKPALYSGAIAFLFPSHYEGFGLPPLEAMSCGTPVIASNRSSLPEVVGQGGLCVDPDDTGALTRAMGELIRDNQLCNELGQAALSQARRFSWTQTAQATMAAYRYALAH